MNSKDSSESTTEIKEIKQDVKLLIASANRKFKSLGNNDKSLAELVQMLHDEQIALKRRESVLMFALSVVIVYLIFI